MSQREEQSSRDRVLGFLRDWAIPSMLLVATASSSATAAWVLSRRDIRDVERRLGSAEACILQAAERTESLRDDFDAKHIAGPDGMVDPVLHLRLDRHIQHWLESELSRVGWRKLVNDYGTNGAKE